MTRAAPTRYNTLSRQIVRFLPISPTHAGTYDDELALLIVHGTLHVLGHDHADEAETAAMQAREQELLGRHHRSGS